MTLQPPTEAELHDIAAQNHFTLKSDEIAAFQALVVGNRRILPSHDLYGGIQVVESLFLNNGRQIGCHTPSPHRFLRDDDMLRLLH